MAHKYQKLTLTALIGATLLCCAFTSSTTQGMDVRTKAILSEQNSEANAKAEESSETQTTGVKERTTVAEGQTTSITPISTTKVTTTKATTTTTAIETTVVSTTDLIGSDMEETTVTEDFLESQEFISLESLEISFDMDVSVTSGLSREDFIYVMENLPYDYCGYFSRNAGGIWDECQQYGVNEFFVCGITAWESGWGQIAGFGSNNYFGIRGGSYATEADGIHGLVSLLANNYLHEGGSCYNGATITGVGHCYCDPDLWPTKVYECMKLIVTSV